MSRHVTSDTELYHVAGILVHAVPARGDEVGSRIEALRGARVHARAGGRIAATLEGPVSAELIAALDAIRSLPGVLSALIVSEHSEPVAGIDEEMPHDC